MRMTSLLDCHFCAISEFDPEAGGVVTLAEYDHAGRRLPDASPYRLRDFPLTRRVLEEQATAVVNVDDPEADPAEVAELRREGDRSLLIVPLVHRGQSIGVLEVVDQKRSREYSRQELRLASAIAGQAAVAIHNAKLFAERRRSDEDIASLRESLGRLTAAAAGLPVGRPAAEVLQAIATAVCDASRRSRASPACGGESAGAFGAGPVAEAGADAPRRGTSASLLVARDPSGRTDLTLAVTLGGAAGRRPGRAARLRRRGRAPRSPRPEQPPGRDPASAAAQTSTAPAVVAAPASGRRAGLLPPRGRSRSSQPASAEVRPC